MTSKIARFLTRNIVKNAKPNSRCCSGGLVYEKTRITNKQLDVNTLYLLDKYSRYGTT